MPTIRVLLVDDDESHAEALADSLAEFKFAALYCSPVLRALETAQIVGRRFGLTPQVADGLREYDVGVLEGQTYSQETEDLYWQAKRRWIEQGAQWKPHWSFVPVEGVPIPQVRDTAWPKNPIDRFVLARLERETDRVIHWERQEGGWLAQLPPARDRQDLYRARARPLSGRACADGGYRCTTGGQSRRASALRPTA